MAGSIESPGFGGILIDQEFDSQVQADTQAAARLGTSVSTYLTRSGQLPTASAANADTPAATDAGLDDELVKYEEYLQKKLQLEKEYAERIRKIRENTELDESERNARALEQHRELTGKLAAEDMAFFSGSGLWSVVGDKLQKASVDALHGMLEKLREMRDGLVADDPMSEQTETAFERISQIYDELSTRNPFVGLQLAEEQWQAALEEVALYEEQLEKADQERLQADNRLAPLQEQVDAGTRSKDDVVYTNALRDQAKALEHVTTAQNRVALAQGHATAAQNAYVTSLDKVKKQVVGVMNDIRDFTKLFDEDAAESIGKVADLFGSVVGAVTGVNSALSSVSSSVEGVGEATSASLKTVETASVILAVISAAFQIATAIAGLFSNTKQMERIQKDSELRLKQLDWEREHSVAMQVDREIGGIAARYRELCNQQYLFGVSVERVGMNHLGMSKRVAEALRSNETLTREIVASYASLDYSVSHQLSGDKFRESQEQMKNMAKQMTELNIQLMAEQDKNKGKDQGKIQDYQRQIQELGEEMAVLLGDLTEGIIGDTPDNLADRLGTAFIDAFAAGEDAAAAWGKEVDGIVSDIIKRMIMMKVVEPAIASVFDKYQKIWFDENTGAFAGFDAVIASMGDFKDDMNAQSEELAEFLRTFEGLGLLAPGSEAGKEVETLSRGIQGVTEDTAGLLASYLNAMYHAQATDGEVLRSIQSLLGHRYASGNLYLTYLQEISANTFNSARAAAQIAAHFNRIVMPRRGGPGLALNVNA